MAQKPGIRCSTATAHSLDSFAYVGGRPLIGAIDPNGYLAVADRPQYAGDHGNRRSPSRARHARLCQ